MPEQLDFAKTAEKVVIIATEMATSLINHLLSKGYFLKINHIGFLLQQSYMTTLCITLIRSESDLSSNTIESVMDDSKGMLREWLVAVYRSASKETDYHTSIDDLLESMNINYRLWCDEMAGSEEITSSKSGKWIPAATANCLKRIKEHLEFDLDVSLSHELNDLNEIIYRYIGELN